MMRHKLLVGAIVGALAFGAGFFFAKKVWISEGITFLGELELAEAPLQDPGFADFERLPFIEDSPLVGWRICRSHRTHAVSKRRRRDASAGERLPSTQKLDRQDHCRACPRSLSRGPH